jgi:hypothetical protein
MSLGARTLIIMTLCIMIFSIMTLSVTTFNTIVNKMQHLA